MPAAFRLDHKGIREILNSSWMQGEVNAAAEAIAEEVRAHAGDMPVTVDHYRTDRGAAAVAVTDVRAMGEQAKNGLLTNAAANRGLEVKSK